MAEDQRDRPKGGERRRLGRLVVAAGCLVVALLAGAHLDQLFLDGHLGYAGALRGVIGRNYLRYDLAETRLAPLQNGGETHGGPPQVRANHPPLAGMLVGLAFRVLGPSPWAARLVPLTASILVVPLLFGFVRRLWDPAVASVAVAIWCLAPFVAIYGAMASYEPLVLLAWVALLWAWSRYRGGGEGRRGPLVVAALATATGVWTDWPMVLLASGLLATEVAAVILARPRRPALLLVVASALVLSLAALAAYYLLLLDVPTDRLESLYRFRSGLGRWEPAAVAAHVASRSLALLTWPVAALGLAGLLWMVVGRPGRPAPAAPAGRALVIAGLVAPPFALLVALPQHAVIHCFSAWYLLPAAVVGAAVVVVAAGRAARLRLGRPAQVALGAGLAALLAWRAAPVVADGWVSDGSPLEGRPRLGYEHLVVAEWARDRTSPEEQLLVDPRTGVTGVRAWFHLDRRVRRLGRAERPEPAVAASQARLALLAWDRLGSVRARSLLERHGGTVVDRVLAVDASERRAGIEVLEIVEEAPGPLWPLLRSASYPPHRLARASAREAVYRSQLRGGSRELPSPRPPPEASLAELAARHLLVLGRGESAARAEEELLAALDARADEEGPCEGVRWVGAALEASPAGRVTLRVVLRATRELGALPRLRATLRGPEEVPVPGALVPDDAFRWPAGSYVVASHRIEAAPLPGGRYVVALSGCGHDAESDEAMLRPRTMLPVHRPVGRL